MIICKICNENIKNYATFWRHLKIHNLTTKDYYDKFLKKENEGICLNCGKETKYVKSKGYSLFCSHKCCNSYKELNNKRSETSKKVWKLKTKEEKDLIHKKGLSTYCKQHNIDKINNIMDLKEIKDKIKETCLKKYGVDNYSKTVNAKEHLSILQKNKSKEQREIETKKFFETIQKRNHGLISNKYFYDNNYFDSSFELYYYIWLKDNNIDFEYHNNDYFIYEFNNIKHRYYPDFIVNNSYVEIKNDFLMKLLLKENTIENAKYKCMLEHNVKILTNKDVKFYENYFIEKGLKLEEYNG